MHPIRSLIPLALALAGLTLALAGCGGRANVGRDAGRSSDGVTTTSTRTYTNDQHGFSITYGDQLTQGDPVSGTGAGVFGGKYEYQITAQATSEDWDTRRGPLEAAVKSFTVQ